jgi:hypothetical protein
VELGFELKAYTFSHSTSPFFFPEIGYHELFAWGWLQTGIFLIFTSSVAKIASMSHQCLAKLHNC